MTKRMYKMSVPAENKEDDDDELTSNFRLRRAFHSHSFAFFFQFNSNVTQTQKVISIATVRKNVSRKCLPQSTKKGTESNHL